MPSNVAGRSYFVAPEGRVEAAGKSDFTHDFGEMPKQQMSAIRVAADFNADDLRVPDGLGIDLGNEAGGAGSADEGSDAYASATARRAAKSVCASL